jgi:ankyrin repeat protein
MLHLAVWFSNKRMVENLLEHGFDVAAKDVVLAIQHEETPLHLAAYQNNQEIYDLLKSRPNSDPTLKNRVRFIQEGKTADDLLKENSN